jgi:hypothetical protein
MATGNLTPHFNRKARQMAIKLDFKQSTWDKNKPKDLKKDNLSPALKDVEKTMGDDKKLAACIAAINQASVAAEDLMDGDCNAKKNKELNAALKKLVGDCRGKIKELQEALDESSEDEDEEGDDLNKLLGKDKFGIFLKKAKSADTADKGTGFCFCFHKLDGTKCELVLVPPAKVNSKYAKLKSKLPKIDSEYKKRNIVTGMAYRDDKFLVLECLPGEEPPEVPGMDKKLRTWAKSHKSDISPMKKVRMSIPGMAPIVIDVPEDNELEDSASETEEQATTGVPPQAPPTMPEATATATAGAVPPQAPAPTNGAVNPEAMENRRVEFVKARLFWNSALETAVQTIEKVKDAIRDHYLDDPELFKVATSKLKQFDTIMDNIGDDLRDVLDQYVSTPKSRQEQLRELGNQARETAEKFLSYVKNDALLNAVDNEADMGLDGVKIREPLEKALKDLISKLA